MSNLWAKLATKVSTFDTGRLLLVLGLAREIAVADMLGVLSIIAAGFGKLIDL